MKITFSKYRKVFYTLSTILALISLVSIFVFGLNLGIDFTGGSVLEVVFDKELPNLEEAREVLAPFELGDFVLQQQGEKGLLLKMKTIDGETKEKILNVFDELSPIKVGAVNFESIGPAIGKELESKTKVVIVVALLAVLIYIAFSFRKVSRPVKSYIFGLTSLIALFHDVLISLGVFVFLGKFLGVEITIPIITAFLTVFGYSINDSVVVFDRIRENLLKDKETDFSLTIDKSLNQSLSRSINTSFTTMIALLAIFFFGGTSLKFFALSLILGIGLGTYSSLFLAAPLLASYLRFKERKYR